MDCLMGEGKCSLWIWIRDRLNSRLKFFCFRFDKISVFNSIKSSKLTAGFIARKTFNSKGKG
jgi:hypothetical protein